MRSGLNRSSIERGADMYGMLLESVQHFIRSEHGDVAWREVLEAVGCRNAVFSTHQLYPDQLMLDISSACSDLITDPLLYFGRCFVRFFSHYGYDGLIRASGRHFRHFVHGVDNLHHQIRFGYPKMQSPSFYVEREDSSGLRLHYRSRRIGFERYVMGQFLEIAETFYKLELQLEVVQSQPYHVIYEMRFDNNQYNGLGLTLDDCLLPNISSSALFDLFPFSVAFDPTMTILQIGDKISQLFDGAEMIGDHVHKYYFLHRPRMDFTWCAVLTMQKVVVELECRRRQGKKALLLKGQMLYFQEEAFVVYLGVPLLGNLQEMSEAGLYLADLSLHDGSREVTMAGWQHDSRLELTYETLEQRSFKLGENLKTLDEWRQRSDDLLYSMIPKQVAKRLRSGQNPVDTCQSFDMVTLLFCEIVDFGELCSLLQPMETVTCVNSVFSAFDRIIDTFAVYKVETIGEVYMLVGGAPDYREDHAQNVGLVALRMVHHVDASNTRIGNKLLCVRLGIHSGPVVAGVVGRRMLRYCLFGDTVNTAARMQSHGQEGKIHISDTAYELMKEDFFCVLRGRISVKGKGEMMTYWLLSDKPHH